MSRYIERRIEFARQVLEGDQGREFDDGVVVEMRPKLLPQRGIDTNAGDRCDFGVAVR